MSPKLRRAYEKRAPLEGGRRGRRSDVPLDVYYELDDLFNQVDGLRQIVGVDRSVPILVATGATPDEPAPGTGAPPGGLDKNVARVVTLDFQGAAGSNSSSLSVIMPWPFTISNVSFVIESSSGSGGISARPFLYIAGKEKMTATANKSKGFTHLVAYVMGYLAIDDNSNVKPAEWAANQTMQAKITGASPNSRVKALVSVTERVTIVP